MGSDSSDSEGDYKKYKPKKEKKDKDKHGKEGKEGKEKKDKKDKPGKEEKYNVPGVGKVAVPGGLVGALTGALTAAVAGSSGHGGGGGHAAAGASGHGGYKDPHLDPHAAQATYSAHAPAPAHGSGHGMDAYASPPLMPSNAYSYAPPPTGHVAGADLSHLPPYFKKLNTHSPLPPPNDVGFAACTDTGGEPLFLVLVPQGGGLHPGKMVVRPGNTHGEVYVSYGGREIFHNGDFALIPFDPNQMHWVPATHGVPPQGVRPVEGGREADGKPMYFALGIVNGGRVPGKAAPHLGGAFVAFGGNEVGSEQSEILCWR